MTYSAWGDDFSSADMTGVSKFVTFKPNKNIVVRYIRTAFVIYNDPVFTDLNAKIYSVGADNVPVELLHTSTDSRTKAEIHTLANGVKSTYFTFNDIPLQENTYYNLVINGTGYLPTTNSYIAWKLAFPDPVYRDPIYTYGFANINRCPFDIELVSGEF